MLFWIIIALIISVTAYAIWEGCDWLDGIPILFLSSIVGLVVIFLTAVLIPCNVDLVHQDKSSLKALGTASANEGTFFLGSGYVDGKRVLNYIQQADSGSIQVSQANAKDSLIFEDASKAAVTTNHFDYINGWIVPWPIGSIDTYEFHIPAGSVAESYAITNK